MNEVVASVECTCSYPSMFIDIGGRRSIKAGCSEVHEAQGDGFMSWQAHQGPFWYTQENGAGQVTVLVEGHGQRH